MKYYSTNKQAPDASLEEAVVKGLAADKGLFMPYSIKPLPQDFMIVLILFLSGDCLSRSRCFLWGRCTCRNIETNRLRYIEF